MKAIFFLLACACLINSLAGFYIRENEQYEVGENNNLNALFSSYEKLKDGLAWDVERSTGLSTEWGSTGSSTQPTTWTPVSSTSEATTTTTTTRKPSSGRQHPQIYNNAIGSLSPFAGRLANVLLNKQGAQETIQENGIRYNFGHHKLDNSTEI